MKTILLKNISTEYKIWGKQNDIFNHMSHMVKEDGERTLCGIKLHGYNLAIVYKIQEIGCQKCIEKYQKEISR